MWALTRLRGEAPDLSAIPKSTNPDRIAENFDVFEFELSTKELAKIDPLDAGPTTHKSSPEMDERYASFTIPEP